MVKKRRERDEIKEKEVGTKVKRRQNKNKH